MKKENNKRTHEFGIIIETVVWVQFFLWKAKMMSGKVLLFCCFKDVYSEIIVHRTLIRGSKRRRFGQNQIETKTMIFTQSL